MAVYPPPLIQSDIFNSALFSTSTTAIVSGGVVPTPPTTEYVDFPEPQGELTFLDGTGVRTTISASTLTLSQNIGITADGVGFNAVGIAYQPPAGDPVAITWDNLATKVEAIGAITQASDATTINVNNAIQIQNGETISTPTQYITISADNSGNRISLDGSYGEVGQVLLSGGENGSLSWGAGGGGSQSLQEVLDVSNVAVDTSIISQTADTFFTTTISAISTNIADKTLGNYDFTSNNINSLSNTISHTKASGFFLYEEYSNVQLDKSITLQYQDGFVGAPPNVPNVVAKCEILTDSISISNYTDNVITATSSLSTAGLTMSVPDPLDPLNTVFVVGLEQNTLSYRDANNTANQSGMSSGGFNVYVENPLDPGQPFTAISIDPNGFTTTNPDNQTEGSGITPQGVSVEITDTGNGDNFQTTMSSGGVFITLQNNDLPENPAPANLIDISTISIKEDQNDANNSKTTVLGQHNLNFQQMYLGESKDLLQMETNSLKMYDITTQTELVNLQNLNDLNGQLTLFSTENTNQISLTNNSLVFSAGNSNNWSITQSTDTANNLTISQTGTAGYMDLDFYELLIRGGAGNAGQVLTSGGTNGAFTWETPGGGWVGTAESNLDMGVYDITSSSGTLNLNATDIEITGQANFVSPPHIPEPILGNDAASKGYVDSLVGQYSGGFNLFLNYSETSSFDPAYEVLSQLVSSAVQQTVDTNITDANPELITQFLTEPIGITTLPQGIWDLLLYASVDTTQDSTTTYFELGKMDENGGVGTIGTSGISPDINASSNNNPTTYSMSLTVPYPVSLNLTDRLFIRVYGQTTHNNTVVLRSFYEGNYYSFLQTPLNSGTTLLSSNNNWTGTNDFAINPTTPSKTTPANTDIINYADIQRLSTPIVSTLDYYIITTSPYFQYPPAPPTSALITTYQYYGWYFINSVVARKIDWYFAPDYNMTVADVKGLYMNYLNITTTSNDNLPFISIYTKPTGTNDYAPGFYHSVNTFVPTFTPIAGTPYCSFMNISGTQQDPFPYGHILGSMAQSTINNPRGQYLPTEQVLAVTVGSNSGSSVNQVAFIMSKVGICLEQGNQELILNPQNINEQPTLSTVLALGSAAGNQSITGVNNLAATSLTTPTLANGAATLTIGTVGQITNVLGTLQNNGTALPAYISAAGVASGSIDMSANNITNCPRLDSASALALGGTTALGVSVGRLTQTTNLVGNVQLNGSSGSSGQVLTSTGATTAPAFSALPTPYISASGVASGAIDMSANNITNCPRLDSASALALGSTTALGVNVGRSAQTTDLLGNVRVNGSSGTSGQALISTGATTAPTWQAIPSGNITYYQSFATEAVSIGGTNNIGLPLTFNVPTSTATYLFTCSTSVGPNGSSGAGAVLLFTFTYQVGGGSQTTASRNVISNNAYTTALTSATSITQQVVPPTGGTNTSVSFQYIYRPGAGTGFAVGSYTFGISVTVSGAGTPLTRSGTITATQLVG